MGWSKISACLRDTSVGSPGPGGLTAVDRGRPAGLRPSIKLAALVLLGTTVLVVSMAMTWGLTADARSVRATMETVLMISGLTSVLLVWGPWSRSGRATDLLALAALLALALIELEHSAGPAMLGSRGSIFGAGTSIASRGLFAAVFAAAALAPRTVRAPEGSRATVMLLVVAVCPLVAGLVAVLTGSGTIRGTWAAILLTAPAICLLLAAAAGFVRRSAREPSGRVSALLGAAAALLAGAWTYSLLVPVLAPGSVTGSMYLRAASFGLILVVALEVRAQQGRAEIEEVVARERRRMAGYLHDGMAQDLALIAAHEDRLARDLGAEHPVAMAARHALAAARGVIVDLSASQEPTATAALQAVGGELGLRYGVQVDVEAGAETLAGEEREAVVRIAREAIVNAVRHGGAQHIHVILDTHGDRMMLTIDDDGCGFEEPAAAGPKPGYGFTEMTDWAQSVGGQLTTQQGAHGGAAVKVMVS